MALPHAGTLAERLLVSGPLLYIGLSMAMDPESLASAAAAVSGALRDFARALRQFPTGHRGPESPAAPLAARLSLRCAGLVLAGFAFFLLTGIIP